MMLLLLLATVVSLIVVLIMRSTSYWTRRGLPQVPGARFPFGHVWSFTFRTRSFGDACCRLYWMASPSDKLIGAYLFTKPAVVFRDPELIKAVLVKDFNVFHDRGFDFNEEVDPLTGHLFLLTGEKWRALRNKLSPTFTSGKMKMMFPTMAKCGREMAEVLSGEPHDLEVRDLLARFGTDVIASCAFGIEARALRDPEDEFRRWGRRLTSNSFSDNIRTVARILLPRFSALLKVKTVPQDVEDYFMGLVKDTMDYRDTHDITRADFLQLLMRLRDGASLDDNSSKTSDKKQIQMNLGELAAQVFVFFIAGFETSSATMSFALHQLAWNQDVQRRLQQEIDETLEKNGGELTYDCVMSMPYMDKVVSETLRRFPPVPVLNREVSQEYHVPGTNWTLEKGTAIILPVKALHWDPQYYPEPERFDPERFSDEAKAKRHPYVYLPFGEGPRNCIGMRFGLMQSKVGLASLLSRYSFEPCSRTELEPKMDPKAFVQDTVSGFWLRCIPRNY